MTAKKTEYVGNVETTGAGQVVHRHSANGHLLTHSHDGGEKPHAHEYEHEDHVGPRFR